MNVPEEALSKATEAVRHEVRKYRRPDTFPSFAAVPLGAAEQDIAEQPSRHT